MADQVSDKVDATAPAVEAPAASADNVAPEPSESAAKVEAKTEEGEAIKDDKLVEEAKPDDSAPKKDDATDSAETAKVEEKAADADTEMKDAAPAPEAQEASAIDATADTTATETPSAKNKNRRKSAGGDTKGKTLSRKASKAKITHTNAKPGDHFLVKLKGFPAWPAIVCDEEMLPEVLLNSRPVTAARKDGTYNENYADGGKRVNDRTFPVMYLHTWEFGWVSNRDFTELSPEKAKDSVNDKMRKDLKAAYELAAEGNSVDHYKNMLREFQEEAIKRQEAEAAAAATPKKSKKAKAADEDVDMADAGESAKAKSKKRKADEETSTPQRSDSVKKPKIKLNTSSTPKTANGTPAAKKDESAAKPAKAKKQKSKDGSEKEKGQEKETKMTPEERHARKEKEVMYLRHKLQRGLLTRDQQPQESEMQQMSEYVSILEKLKDLEVSIIRATKINKVLKAILKLDNIPKEEEFKFKPRSQALLEKWNKLMDSDSGATNGVNGSAETEKKPEANGSMAPAAAAAAEPEKPQPAAAQDETKADASEASEEPAKAETTTAAAEPVEAAA